MEEFKSQEQIGFPEIAQEINEMAAADQDMREKEINEPDFWDDSVDKKNTEGMKKIIGEIGWPSVSKVGIFLSSFFLIPIIIQQNSLLPDLQTFYQQL